MLGIGCEDGVVQLYDLQAGKAEHTWRAHQSECRSVRITRGSERQQSLPLVLSGSYDHTVGLTALLPHGGLNTQYLTRHRDKVIQARWHPDMLAFASSSADKTVRLWIVS